MNTQKFPVPTAVTARGIYPLVGRAVMLHVGVSSTHTLLHQSPLSILPSSHDSPSDVWVVLSPHHMIVDTYVSVPPFDVPVTIFAALDS